ncbi:cytochrome c [Shimia thalassica]|uniref:c-type cytochrome n=1 Tax=Shimia thalassica TaxID=1715693 RepID=UPI0027350F6B|nr:cytochrome c [Shimia thalassica]MDP2520620.1 cytochrome c [Shimia thalassica]MDP2582004.1 cytochrome c [Shimia thalassica]
MKKTTVLATLIATSTAFAALAHGGATGIVKERMDAMADMGKAVKAITPMMRGETDYDAKVVRQAAATFSRHAGESMTDLFPEGSGGMPSEAKDAIWSKWAEFSALAGQLGIVSEGLAGAADNGLMGGGSGMMGSGSGMMGSGSGMMGGSGAMGRAMTAAQISEMPVDGAFTMLTQVCSACHTQFRAESK